MTQTCLQHVECKNCGEKGHLRRECDGPEITTKIEVKDECDQPRMSPKVEVKSECHPITNPTSAIENKQTSMLNSLENSGLSIASSKAAARHKKIPKRLMTKEQWLNLLTFEDQIIKECVEDLVSPTALAIKWQCNPGPIKTWVRKAGKKLPKRYKNTNNMAETGEIKITSEKQMDVNEGNDIAEQGGKRKSSTQVKEQFCVQFAQPGSNIPKSLNI